MEYQIFDRICCGCNTHHGRNYFQDGKPSKPYSMINREDICKPTHIYCDDCLGPLLEKIDLKKSDLENKID